MAKSKDIVMLYDHEFGKMLAIGERKDVELTAKDYMQSLQLLMEMREEQRKRSAISAEE